jgi:hypothetical protein
LGRFLLLAHHPKSLLKKWKSFATHRKIWYFIAAALNFGWVLMVFGDFV